MNPTDALLKEETGSVEETEVIIALIMKEQSTGRRSTSRKLY